VLRAVAHDPHLLGHVTVRRKGLAHSRASYVVPESVSRDDQVGSDVVLLQVRVPLTAVALLDLVVPSEAVQGLLRDVHASTKFSLNCGRERSLEKRSRRLLKRASAARDFTRQGQRAWEHGDIIFIYYIESVVIYRRQSRRANLKRDSGRVAD